MHNQEVLQGTGLLVGLILAAHGKDMQLDKLAAIDLEQYYCDPNYRQQQDPQQQDPQQQQQRSSTIVPTGSVGIMCLDRQGGAAGVLNVVPRQSLAAFAVQLGVDGVLAADAGVKQLLTEPTQPQQHLQSIAGIDPLQSATVLGSRFALHTQKGTKINRAVFRHTLEATSSSPNYSSRQPRAADGHHHAGAGQQEHCPLLQEQL
jgi:hypothetical protein